MLLLVLNLCNLVGVLIASIVPPVDVRVLLPLEQAAPELLELGCLVDGVRVAVL